MNITIHKAGEKPFYITNMFGNMFVDKNGKTTTDIKRRKMFSTRDDARRFMFKHSINCFIVGYGDDGNEMQVIG